MPRPCPFVSCRHHLYLEIVRGKLKVSKACQDMEVDEALMSMPFSCSLDAAEEGGLTLNAIGDIFGISRERIRQIEAESLRYIRIVDSELTEAASGMAPVSSSSHIVVHRG